MTIRLRHTLTFLLAAIMLVSGSGIVLGKMICLKTGREIVKINSAVDSCCTDEEQETEFEKACCTFINYSIATDNFVQSSLLLLKAPLWFETPAPLLPSFTLLLSSQPLPAQVCSKPPPRNARVMLQLNQTFLI
jgi:hypothetical protein